MSACLWEQVHRDSYGLEGEAASMQVSVCAVDAVCAVRLVVTAAFTEAGGPLPTVMLAAGDCIEAR